MTLIYQQAAVTINGPAFIDKLLTVAKILDINPNWLMCVIRAESAFKPTAKNPYNGAAGLIQFISSTAKGLGTTLEVLYKMNGVQQLDYVLKYYMPYARYINSPEDLYLATFYPSALIKGRPDTYVIGSERDDAYARLVATQNPVFDLDRNKYVSLGEFRKYIRTKTFAGLSPEELKKKGFLRLA